MTTTEACTQCEHPLDDHLMVTTSEDADPMKGGVTLCPVRGCQCYATWAPTWGDKGSRRNVVRIPDDDEVSAMRAEMQGIRRRK